MNAPSLLILIAGPCRSGTATGDDPALTADLMHRDAVLRLPGESTGAVQDVAARTVARLVS